MGGARRLRRRRAPARHVGYVHVKAATQGPRGWRAIALDDTDGSWRDLLARLPHEAPRGIEFPLQGDDTEAVITSIFCVRSNPR